MRNEAILMVSHKKKGSLMASRVRLGLVQFYFLIELNDVRIH